MESLLTHIDADNHVTKFVAAAGVVIIVAVASQLFSSFRVQRALKRYPIINEKWDSAAKKHFTEQASKLVDEGSALAKGNPFRLNDKGTQRLVLPPRYIDEIKNDNRLDFHGFVAKEFHSTTPGFDAFSSSVNQTVFQDAVRTQLTQALALTVDPMAKEAPNTLNLVFGDAPEWKEVVLIPSLLRCISRLTALIFLGDKFMNNPDWQRISVMYTVDAFMAAKALNNWNPLLRPIVHWFMPECKKIREEVKIARALITPEVKRRRKELVENGGKPRRKVLDSVDWFTASAKGADFDYVGAELSLSMASIHTTNNTLSFAIFDLVQHPEYFKPLREEILRVYNEEGKWEKSTLFKLRLMDSFLKESMRYNPHTVLNMPRQATEDLTLKDGTLIPKRTFIYIGPQPMKDPKNFPSPEVFDGYRFLKLREAPGAENKHQFVTTAPEITVFGHGHHSCPGRFFASNELKLLLAHMIMYYDWKLPDGQTVVPPTINGTSRSPNSRQKVLYKSRTPEVPL